MPSISDIEHYDVVVVGAGWYGLVTAHTFLKLAPESRLSCHRRQQDHWRSMERGENFHKPVIHSVDFGSWRHRIESDAVNRATVVGASKSSYDTVYNLLKSGEKIDWIIRKSNSGPFSLFAPTFMRLWHISDHISTRLAASFSPSIMNISGHWNMFLQRTAPGQFITRLYWQVATALASQYAQFSKSEHTQYLRPWPHHDGLFWGGSMTNGD
ncbi:hypothetical protein MauCBS54593_000050 [Microsporum audouinii]